MRSLPYMCPHCSQTIYREPHLCRSMEPDPRTVWTVSRDEGYDGIWLMAIFSTEEKAAAYVGRVCARDARDKLDIVEVTIDQPEDDL